MDFKFEHSCTESALPFQNTSDVEFELQLRRWIIDYTFVCWFSVRLDVLL